MANFPNEIKSVFPVEFIQKKCPHRKRWEMKSRPCEDSRKPKDQRVIEKNFENKVKRITQDFMRIEAHDALQNLHESDFLRSDFLS